MVHVDQYQHRREHGHGHRAMYPLRCTIFLRLTLAIFSASNSPISACVSSMAPWSFSPLVLVEASAVQVLLGAMAITRARSKASKRKRDPADTHWSWQPHPKERFALRWGALSSLLCCS